MRLYKKAADKGDIESIFSNSYHLKDRQESAILNTYALILEQGDGVSVNYHEAAKYYKMAIEKGNAAAMYNYAKMLEKGNAAAMYNYAKMLEKGNGLSINYTEAIKYYKMAAANGYPIAMNDLGLMYLNCGGVDINYDEGDFLNKKVPY